MRGTKIVWMVTGALVFWAGPVAAQPQVGPPPIPSGQPPASPVPFPQSLTGQAKIDYDSAKNLVSVKDFTNAILKFQAAHDSSGDPRLFWNMALCERDRNNYVGARAKIERYLGEGGALLSPRDREVAAELLTKLSPHITNLRLTITEPDAEISIDEVRLGVSPSPPLSINMGAHRLRVSKPGFKDFVLVLNVLGGRDEERSVKLEKDVHQGRLVVEAGPRNVIVLDGKTTAEGQWEGILPSGIHTVRVTAPGMIAYQSDVVIQDDKTRRVLVTLDPALKPGSSAVWLWMGGGVLATAGLVAGGYFLFRPRDPVQGNIPTLNGKGTVDLAFGGRGDQLGGGR